MTEHTKGKLQFAPGADSPEFNIFTNGPHHCTAVAFGAGDARRLVACWNACEGLETADLERNLLMVEHEAGRMHVLAAYHSLRGQLKAVAGDREALLDALHAAANVLRGINEEVTDVSEPLEAADAAIAKAEGRA